MTTTAPAVPAAVSSTPSRTTRQGVLAIVLGLLGFALVYALAVLTEAGQRVDNALMDAVAVTGLHHQQLDRLVPSPYLLLVACGVLALVAAARHLRTGLAVVVAVPVLVLSTQVLKALLPRPDLADPWVMANSLPSGHTGAAAALGVTLVLVSPRLLVPLAGAVGVALTGYMGSLVVLLGYHRPSDVLASALLAVAALGLGLLIRGPRRRPRERAAVVAGSRAGDTDPPRSPTSSAI